MSETWHSAQGDEARTAELAPSEFDVKSFPRQSRSRGGGIATVYKSTLGSNITFKTLREKGVKKRGNGGTRSYLSSMTCTDRQSTRFQNLCTQPRANFSLKE